MRRMEFPEEMISEATGFGDTDDEELLNARKTYQELEKKFKAEIKPEAEEVREAGGLFIIGTERHESRRIDNQLRGRSGRQGDPGETRFYLSMEDDLMRLFAGDRIYNIMDSLGIDENTPIEHSMLTNTIENAQKKLESRNFAIRKNVLQYDDVMNRQREIIYSQRDKVLNGEDMKDYIQKMLEETIEANVKSYITGEDKDSWNFEGLRDHYMGWLTTPDDFRFDRVELENTEVDYIIKMLTERAKELYQKREEEFGSNLMREIERVMLLRMVDTKWMDHIDAMEELKKGISLRAYAQKDPVVEYRIEGFDMFDEMIASIQEDTVRLCLTIQIRKEEEPKREQVAKPIEPASDKTDSTSRTVKKKPGRNDPCPCGSGKKYKKCCGKDA